MVKVGGVEGRFGGRRRWEGKGEFFFWFQIFVFCFNFPSDREAE